MGGTIFHEDPAENKCNKRQRTQCDASNGIAYLEARAAAVTEIPCRKESQGGITGQNIMGQLSFIKSKDNKTTCGSAH